MHDVRFCTADYMRGAKIDGGDGGIRTPDPHVANVMLSQLSYIPTALPLFLLTSPSQPAHSIPFYLLCLP